MKRFFIGLALSGLAARANKYVKALTPGRNDSSASGGAVRFLLGAGAGAGLALLFTTTAGRELRARIVDTINGRRQDESVVADRRKERIAAAIEAGEKAFREERQSNRMGYSASEGGQS